MIKKIIIILAIMIGVLIIFKLTISFRQPKHIKESIGDIHNEVVSEEKNEIKEIEVNSENIIVDHETTEERTKEIKDNENVSSIENIAKDNKQETKNDYTIKKDNIEEKKNETQNETKEKVQKVEEKEIKKEAEIEKNTDKKTEEKAEKKTEEKIDAEEKNKTQEKVENCTNIDNHFMPVGNSKRWFKTKEEAISLFDKTIKEWGDKWVNNEIDSDKYYANCPYRIRNLGLPTL